MINRPRLLQQDTIKGALSHLAQLISEQGETIEMTCAGGIVSVMHFQSRPATHDIDVIYPEDPWELEALKSAIPSTAAIYGIESSQDDPWINDSIGLFGLRSRSETPLFSAPGLILYAATWEEMLALKLNAFRHDIDIDDAILILTEIQSGRADKNCTWEGIRAYFPAVARTPEATLYRRFDRLWEAAKQTESRQLCAASQH